MKPKLELKAVKDNENLNCFFTDGRDIFLRLSSSQYKRCVLDKYGAVKEVFMGMQKIAEGDVVVRCLSWNWRKETKFRVYVADKVSTEGIELATVANVSLDPYYVVNPVFIFKAVYHLLIVP